MQVSGELETVTLLDGQMVSSGLPLPVANVPLVRTMSDLQPITELPALGLPMITLPS